MPLATTVSRLSCLTPVGTAKLAAYFSCRPLARSFDLILATIVAVLQVRSVSFSIRAEGCFA
jgi:hypothetical protein